MPDHLPNSDPVARFDVKRNELAAFVTGSRLDGDDLAFLRFFLGCVWNYAASEDGVAYTVSGPTENVFASLVVLLGYTHTFTRTAQWQNNASLRDDGDGPGADSARRRQNGDEELDFVLCFGSNVGLPVRTLFQGLFESFLTQRNPTVVRYEPVRCPKCGHLLDRSVARQKS